MEPHQATCLELERETHAIRLVELLEQRLGLARASSPLAQHVKAATSALTDIYEAEHEQHGLVARVRDSACLHLVEGDAERTGVRGDDTVGLSHEHHPRTSAVVSVDERVREGLAHGTMLRCVIDTTHVRPQAKRHRKTFREHPARPAPEVEDVARPVAAI